MFEIIERLTRHDLASLLVGNQTFYQLNYKRVVFQKNSLHRKRYQRYAYKSPGHSLQ